MTSPTKPQTLTQDSLRTLFDRGCKTPSELAVGVEWEKIGILQDSGEAIPYSGPSGVKAIFQGLSERYGWKMLLSANGQPIALKKGTCSITLEPGGQIELSGQKAAHLADNAAELHQHLKQIREVSAPLGVVWLGLGAQPFSRADSIEWVPKDRYRIMRESLAGQGELTFSMMKETASVQISVDYLSEQDASEKMRLAMALSPVLTALFANSPLESGLECGFLSRRANIWHHTDPRRTGILWDVFDNAFGFDDYVEYALGVPLLFLTRDGQWIKTGRLSFREYLKSGWSGYEATEEDWELHLSSLFTEARLKSYLEIRSVDCQNVATSLGAVAFIKGLFYDPAARKAAWEILKGLTLEERKELTLRAPRQALQTPFKDKKTLKDIAVELAGFAKQGLAENERTYLEPVVEILKEGVCPAEKLLRRVRNAADKTELLQALIRCCAI